MFLLDLGCEDGVVAGCYLLFVRIVFLNSIRYFHMMIRYRVNRSRVVVEGSYLVRGVSMDEG